MFGIKQAATRVRLSIPVFPTRTHIKPQLLQLQAFLPSTFRFAQNSSIASSMDSDVQRIHDFYLTRDPKDWFMPPKGFDQACENEFGALVQKARTSELDDWAAEPKSTLALLVLLDQFPRNIYRGSPEAFGSDAKALDIATKSIAKGFDKQVPLSQVLTFYLPLVHNESLLSTVACVALYENLVSRCSEGSKEIEMAKAGVESAIAHRELIQRFGRYPGRNRALGRQNTNEEEEFLKENPSGFLPSQPK